MENNDALGETGLTSLHKALLEMLSARQYDGSRSPEDYLYVIYARRSTDTGEKQQQSLGDQLTECKLAAERHGLRVAKIYTESESAKTSGIRPVFREMMDAVRSGKYDGIIAWAPDRLARNMREGGEIIDLLDDGTIKDMRFAAFPFENNGNGKMLLGLNFVMAKQWVDNHAINVKRAISHRTLEGVSLGRAKHGYYKDGQGRMRPDAENWALIKGVFERRLQNRSLKDIAEWLEKEGYPLRTVHGQRLKVKIDVAFISALLQETTYTGLMMYGDDIVDLRKLYDFDPLITEEDFARVTGIEGVKKHLKATRVIKDKGIKANLLRHMVICEGCEEPLAPTITTKPKQNKKYFYLRCDTPGCRNERKNIRAKVIVDSAIEFLAAHTIVNEKSYKSFASEMRRLAVTREEDITNKIRGLEQRKRGAANGIEKLKEIVTDTEDKTVRRMYEPDLKKRRAELKIIEQTLAKVRDEKEALSTNIITYEQFVELTQTLAEKLKKGMRMSDLDFVLRKLFSNFYVDGKKVTKITQNSPFRELCAVSDSDMVTPPGVEPGLSD